MWSLSFEFIIQKYTYYTYKMSTFASRPDPPAVDNNTV